MCAGVRDGVEVFWELEVCECGLVVVGLDKRVF